VAVLAAAVLVVAVAGCAHRGRPLPGTTERQLVVDGVPRRYLLHAAGEPKPGRSLVLVLHGLRGSAPDIERRTRGTLDRLADRDGAVIVYPEALGDPRRWNDGWPTGATVDDVAFLAALIESAVADLGVDRRRVFATGLSNGAAMVYRLACERPDLVAAVAPVAGGMSAAVATACRKRIGPVSILRIHGTDDPIAPFGPSSEDVATWIRRDRCPPQPSSSTLPDLDPGDGTRTSVDLYGPCADGTEVAFYAITGGGHAWPGGEGPPFFSLASHGPTPRDFDAGVVIWDFFQKHPRR
jgi:polyhydroxybutyrate depolymerase